jgi:hypothetical protein
VCSLLELSNRELSDTIIEGDKTCPMKVPHQACGDFCTLNGTRKEPPSRAFRQAYIKFAIMYSIEMRHNMIIFFLILPMVKSQITEYGRFPRPTELFDPRSRKSSKPAMKVHSETPYQPGTMLFKPGPMFRLLFFCSGHNRRPLTSCAEPRTRRRGSTHCVLQCSRDTSW